MKITTSEKRVKMAIGKANLVYRFVNYFDVWGNENEGFEVNNLSYENIYIIGGSFNSIDAIAFLKKIGYLKKRFKFSSPVADSHMVEIEYTKTGYPIGRFESISGTDVDRILDRKLGRIYGSNMYNPDGICSIVAIA